MQENHWKVIEKFDQKKRYGTHIPPRIFKIPSSFEKDSIISTSKLKDRHDVIDNAIRTKSEKAIQQVISLSIITGKKIGILEKQ